jgi:hypothetical protein
MKLCSYRRVGAQRADVGTRVNVSEDEQRKLRLSFPRGHSERARSVRQNFSLIFFWSFFFSTVSNDTRIAVLRDAAAVTLQTFLLFLHLDHLNFKVLKNCRSEKCWT